MGLYQRIAAAVRSAGFACEVFPDAKKMAQQYAWAEKKSIRWGILVSRSEVEDQELMTLKDLSSRATTDNLSLSSLIGVLKMAREGV